MVLEAQYGIPGELVELHLVALRLGANTEPLHNPPEDRRVVSPSLLREAEQGEEQEGGKDVHPLTHDYRDEEGAVLPPENCRHLLDVRKLCVSVRPGYPRREGHACGVDVDAVRADRDGADHLRDGEEHESEVAADGHAGSMRGDDLAELDTMLEEPKKCQDCLYRQLCAQDEIHGIRTSIDERNTADEGRPHENQRVCRGSIVNLGEASDALKDIESMSLDDVVWNTVEKK